MTIVRKLQIPIIFLISLLFLSGCSTWSGFLRDIQVTPVDRTPLILPDVDVVDLEEINWYILNDENAAAILDEVQTNGHDRTIFGLSDEGYESSSINQAKMLNLIRQQHAIIQALKEYYQHKEELNDNAE